MKPSVSVAETFDLGSVKVGASVKGGYMRRRGATDVEATFTGAPTQVAPFSTRSFLDRNAGNVGVALHGDLGHGVSVQASYDGEFGPPHGGLQLHGYAVHRFLKRGERDGPSGDACYTYRRRRRRRLGCGGVGTTASAAPCGVLATDMNERPILDIANGRERSQVVVDAHSEVAGDGE